MWTVKQANWVARIFEVGTVVMLIASAIGGVLRDEWTVAGGSVVAAAAVVILIVRKERGGETSVLLAGRANDERQAYLQLRAYATVGQAMMGLFVVLFAIDLLRGTSGPWGWLVAVCGMIGAGTLFVLRQREQ